MVSTSTSSRAPRWPLLLLVLVSLALLSPIIGLLFAGLALAVGLAAVAARFGVIALAIWAVVWLFKGLFGAHPPSPPPSQLTIDVTPEVDPDAPLARDECEHPAPLATEPEHAVAQPNAEAS